MADGLLGKYRTIISLSVVYCAGHLALAVDETRVGLALGLGLIALGSGGIKSCVSAHVGDQFGTLNQHLLGTVFGWFYFAINLGAFASSLATPILLKKFGPSVAFGVPGILMAMATFVFWLGRSKFVHIPPGKAGFLRETFSRDGLLAVGKLCILYVFVSMFWALFDQSSSAWVLQAEHMDRCLFGVELLPSQINAANPILIMLMIPLFSYVVYPLIEKVFRLTPLRKISIGMFITALSFALSSIIETWIAAGYVPHIYWQLLAYVILTASEVMVSITFLEFSYTQAPKKAKSLVMGLFFLSVSGGNAFTALVNRVIQNPDGTCKLSDTEYYWFFTVAMAVTAVVFSGVASKYQVRSYIQNGLDQD